VNFSRMKGLSAPSPWCASVQQQRHRFARPIVNPVECLRRLVPRRGIEHVSQRLLGAMKGVAIVVVQAVVLKHTLDFEQLGHDCIARHGLIIDDSRSGRGSLLEIQTDFMRPPP
jgi:hypothetical protein